MIYNIMIFDMYYFIISILILLIFCIYYGSSRVHNLYSINKQLVCGLSIFFAFYLILICITKYGEQRFFFNMIISNDVTIILHFIVVLTSLLVALISLSFLTKLKVYSFEFYLLFVSVVFGLILLISFTDFIGLYLSLELVSMCFYLLTTFSKHNIYSNEASLKYFILGTISSNFVLFGFSFIYVSTGLVNLMDLSKMIAYYLADGIYYVHPLEGNLVLAYIVLGFFFVFIGFLFKMYAAPFHTWIPDIYQGAPLAVTMLFSTLPLVPFINLILRFLLILNMLGSIWSYFFLFFAISSIVLGTFFSLFQTQIRRLLAYSAVTHVGYFFVFVYLFISTGSISVYLIQLLYMYVIIYIITVIGIFGVLVNLFVIKRYNSSFIEDMYNFSKLSQANHFLSFSLAILFFSMAGLPPLPGFIGKLFLFTSILYSGNKILLFVLIVLMAVLSGFYYLRLIKVIYFNSDSGNGWLYISKIDYISSIVVSLSLIVLFHIYFFPELIAVPCMYIALGYLS